MNEIASVETRREPETTTYHGTDVTEEYRWLEDADSEETKTWTKEQDARTRELLGTMRSFAAIKARAEEILKTESTSYASPSHGGHRYLALKYQPPRQQPLLVTMTDLADVATESTVLDPTQMDPNGTTAIDWYVPSPDGRYVAVSLSSHGTEDGTLHTYECDTGEQVDVEVPRVNSGTAGGSLAWRADSSGFWYTRHPSAEERGKENVGFFQQIWRHTLGQPASADVCDLAGVFADDRIVENKLFASPDGRWVVDLAQLGDGGDYQLFARAQDGEGWWQLADIGDRCKDAAFGGDSLFVKSTKDAPRGQVLRLKLAHAATVVSAKVVVPQSDVTVESVEATEGRLWVVDMDGGPSGLRSFSHGGDPLAPVELPPVCAVTTLVPLGSDQVGYCVESYVSPPQWCVFADDGDRPGRTALDTDFLLDFSGYEVERVFASSDDGTRIPLNVISAKGTPKDGSAPVVLTGYGGYSISLKPNFLTSRLLWLELGGVHAIANIRGGGEYGEEWHDAGRLLTKQTCFDDFAACARHLVESGVTTVDRLALQGGSNGGLLMGAVLTQHPELARAVVAQVPVLDILRVELHPNGAFNVTEFGTVQDPDLFRAMYAYSPVHNVHDGTAYPAVLLTAGEFDPRVDPYHAKKMAARLQAATSSSEPVLLLMEAGGHGIGASLDEQIEDSAFVTAFLVDKLGVPVWTT
jgi:prolyl oligopeptidase